LRRTKKLPNKLKKDYTKVVKSRNETSIMPPRT